jgi:hypothetical protein
VAGATAAGCVLALGSLALTVMLMAAGARRALVLCWVAAAGIGVIVLALAAGLDPTARVVLAFNAAEVVAVGAAAAGLGVSPRV